MKTVSVILPTYNEKENIIPLIIKIRTHVTNLLEILVIDDNSPDGTAHVVKAWITDHGVKQSVRVIQRTSDRGLTKSIAEGIRLARGNIIVWMDADFSMPPENVDMLTTKIHEGWDIAVGSRFIPGGTTKNTGNGKEQWYTVWTSIIANKIMHILFGVDFYDFTSGFVAVKKNVVRSIPLRGSYGEYFIDFIVSAFARGFLVTEVPYICVPRRFGTTKTAASLPALFKRCLQYGMMVIRLLWETNIHPNIK